MEVFAFSRFELFGAFHRWRIASTLVGVLALAGCGGGTSDEGVGALAGMTEPTAAAVENAESVTSEVVSSNASAVQSRVAQIREVGRSKRIAQDVPQIRLGSLNKSEVAVKAEATKPGPSPLQIGTVRAIDATMGVSDLAALLRWQTDATTGRHSAAVRFESAEARGVRLGLQVSQLPPRTVLRVSAPDGESVIEVDSGAVMRTIDLNKQNGVAGSDARLYWLPTLDGESITLEIELAADAEPSMLRIAIPKLVHLWVGLADDPSTLRPLVGESASCNLDVSCAASWDPQSRGVARMYFVTGSSAHLCTGTLLNDKDTTTQIPYFLTSHHCISTPQVAATLETAWFYRSSACGASTYSQPTILRGGATFLYSDSLTDVSFMRLNNPAPAGSYLLGWNATAEPAMASSIVGISHPKGDLQKITYAQVNGYAACGPTDASGMQQCSSAPASTATRFSVRLTQGFIEGGSSGSAAFNSAGQVVGTLFGSPEQSCSSPVKTSNYGRFDVAYKNGIGRWLNTIVDPTPSPPATSPVYRFYNTQTGTHFYTISAMERDFVIATYPSYIPEGSAFRAATQTAPASGMVPVFRFYNELSRTHFYTNSEAERNYVIVTYPSFHYEGIAWYATSEPYRDSSPIHRFYNTERNAHFYTIDPGEFEFVRNNYQSFLYEGVAYHAWR